MLSKTMYDVIILGSGISGLLLASELSKRHTVLVVEKEAKIPDRKYWLTSAKCLQQNADLAPFVDSRYNSMDFIAYDGTTFRCLGEYLLWNTTKLIEHLASVCEANRGRILKSHRFYTFRYLPDGIRINANKVQLDAKLAIDCMGYSSPLIYAKDIVRIMGYYFLHGALIPLKEQIDPLCLGNFMIEAKPKYLEIFPTKDGFAYVALLTPSNHVRRPEDLQSDFSFIIKHSTLSSKFFLEDGITKTVSGIVPAGRIRRNALDRLFFFGEAGHVHPAATAAGLTKMLLHFRRVATFLSERISTDTLAARDLEDRPSTQNRFNQKFQLALFEQVLNWNSDEFRKLVQKMASLKSEVINDILFGELEVAKTLDFRSVSRLLKTRNYFMIRPLLRALFL